MSTFADPHNGSESKETDKDVEVGKDGEDNDGVPKSAAANWATVRSHVGRRGSVLYQNTDEDRDDHLRKLFVKRRLKDRAVKNLRESMQVGDLKAPIFSEVSDVVGDDSALGQMDVSFLKECREELGDELDKDEESAKIQVMEDIIKEYKPIVNFEAPLEVRMENVTYTVPKDENSNKIMTVYNSSFLYRFVKIYERIRQGERLRDKKEKAHKDVLSKINLVLKPGRQYLILGSPGSGKSSLLRAIAGLLKPERKEKLTGSIAYNGKTLMDTSEFHIENAIAYIDQLDKHAPRLTVEETFEFAYQCESGGRMIRSKVDPELEKLVQKADKEHLYTTLVLSALGLAECKKTFVGDDNVRGVSGGQRRRVTVGEILMSRATVLCGDEISNGLDAASTYDMVQVLLHYGRLHLQTRIFALLQPSPETVSLFDDVIVMAEGRIIYAGPIEHVQDYFAEIGFVSPQYTDVADFLQMVSTAEDGARMYKPSEAIRAKRPNAPNASELADIFAESDINKYTTAALESPWRFVWKSDVSSHPTSQVSSLAMSDAVQTKYANNFFRSIFLIFKRFLVIWTRDKRVIIAGVLKNIIMGVSVGGAFTNTTDVLSILGALFQAGMFIMLGSMQSASTMHFDKEIYFKQHDANFYSAWPFIFGRVLSQFPQNVSDTTLFGTILYFMIGLAGRSDAWNFFKYLFMLWTFAVTMNVNMSMYACFFGEGISSVLSSCTLLMMFLFGGFILAPSSIPAYYYWWLYWWNPLAWEYRALVVNEFRSDRWGDESEEILVANGFTTPAGDPFPQSWVGFGFAYLIPYLLICCVLSALGLTYCRSKEGGGEPEPVAINADEEGGEPEEKMVIPFTPVTLSFHDLSYEVTASTSKEKLLLLSKVNGIFHPGRMCALMGSSGAGKTTLMDVIALRKRSGKITGEVLLNGWPQDKVTFRRCSGYVEQFDVQSPELTVRETVLFSARLRLNPGYVEKDEDVQRFVDGVIKDVELTDLADAVVGTDENGLSFEEKKRLSIAVELGASPSLIFLDEPTSGLDARAAGLVVKTLRRIADSNRTVCATIHQPSSAVFSMFDDLLLLKKGGRVCYNGPLGDNCSALVAYFESRGADKISLGENPANWMLRVITDETSGDCAEMYLNSDEYSMLQAELEQIKEDHNEDSKIKFDSEFAASRKMRRAHINKRMRTIYWRSPAYNLARMMVSLLIAFLLGSVFITERKKAVYTELDMRARLSVIFLSFIITGVQAIYAVLPVMTKGRDMFYRHRDAGMYDSLSMGIALGVAEKWFIVIASVLFCIIFLPTAGFLYSTGCIAFWGFFTFNYAIYSYMGQLFVCLVKSMSTALILCTVLIGICNFFSGLVIRPQFMVGSFYAFPYYISPGHYVYEGMVTGLFHDNGRNVSADPGSEFYDSLVEDGTCINGTTNCYGTMAEYVDVFYGGEFQRSHTWWNALILGCILVLTRLGTWLCLKYIRYA